MVTVFDVASELLRLSGGRMGAVKLQKLCFYGFGWYSHLTGEPLFGERFYAMQHGPVVGELLSAHAGRKHVTRDIIAEQQEAREDDRADLDPYVAAVIEAVYEAYKGYTDWQLEALTHEESVWIQAWEARREGTKRGDLHRDELVDFFLDKSSASVSELDLPPAMVSRAPLHELEAIEADASAHQPFVDAIREYRFVA